MPKTTRANIAQAFQTHANAVNNLANKRGTQKDIQALISVAQYLSQALQEAIVLDSDVQAIVTRALSRINADQQQIQSLQSQLATAQQQLQNGTLSQASTDDLTQLKTTLDTLDASQQTGGTATQTTAPQGTTVVSQPVVQPVVAQQNAAGNVGAPTTGAQ